MRFLVLSMLIVCVSIPLFGQWSQIPSQPTLIAGFNGEQVIPKVAVTPSGNVYIARFDNGSGNYDVYLQLFSQAGTPIWPQPAGLLVSNNPSMTWLTDWDMDADANGNAVLVWQDIRSGGVNNVYAYAVNDTGQQLWGANGIALSSDTSDQNANMSPTLFCSSDGSSYFAWQRMANATTVILQRLSESGQKLWGETGITLTSTVGSISWPQIIQADGTNILVKYYEDSGPYWAPTRHMYVAKYNPDGTRLWNTAITTAGGISAWQQVLPFESDGEGGGIIAWYDDRFSDMVNEVYAQRVSSDGSVTMTANGVLLASGNNYQHYYPKLAVDTEADRIYAFYRITDADQNSSGLAGQHLDYQGTLLWGDSGLIIQAISSTVCNTVGAYNTDLGAIVVYEQGVQPNNDQLMHLRAKCFRAGGQAGWVDDFREIASDNSNKLHFDLDVNRDDWMVLAWESGTSSNDIYAMRLNRDGTLGMQFMPPRSLAAQLMPPNGVQLTWQHPSDYWVPLGYQIFMDGEMLQAVPGSQTSFDVNQLTSGEHSFYVIASYGDGNHSAPSNTVFVLIVANTDPVQIVPPVFVSVFPNPVRGFARIAVQGPVSASEARLCIYNLRGRLLLEKRLDLSAGKADILVGEDVISGMASGVHILEVQGKGFSAIGRMLIVK